MRTHSLFSLVLSDTSPLIVCLELWRHHLSSHRKRLTPENLSALLTSRGLRLSVNFNGADPFLRDVCDRGLLHLKGNTPGGRFQPEYTEIVAMAYVGKHLRDLGILGVVTFGYTLVLSHL